MDRLTRMKWLATGLLVLAGIVYVVARAFENQHPWLYYVSVAAEASRRTCVARQASV